MGNIPQAARPLSGASTRSQTHRAGPKPSAGSCTKESTALDRETKGLESATAQDWPWVSSQSEKLSENEFFHCLVFFPEAPSCHKLLYSAKTPGIYSGDTLCWPEVATISAEVTSLCYHVCTAELQPWHLPAAQVPSSFSQINILS